MTPSWIVLFTNTLVACSGIDEGADTAVFDSGPVSYPSSFDTGKYRASGLVVVEETEGFDLDGDGEVDNKLPTLLSLVDPFTKQDMSREGVNATIVEMLAEESLVLLLDAAQVRGELGIDLLLASRDEDSGVLSMDPSSFDADGNPNSRFSGAFLDETLFETGAASAELPFPVVAGEPPVQIPLRDALLHGELLATWDTGAVADTGAWVPVAGTGSMGGALPVDGLIDQVVDKIVPPYEPDTGADPDFTYYDPAAYMNMERDEFMSWVTDVLNENMADLWLEDGSRAVSAALTWELTPATEWPE